MLTQEQIEQRRYSMNSSDMAALFNCPKRKKKDDEDEEPKEGWNNSVGLWCEKTDRLKPEQKSSEAAQAGHYFEPGLIQFCRDQTGREIQTGLRLGIDIEGVRHRSSPDGAVWAERAGANQVVIDDDYPTGLRIQGREIIELAEAKSTRLWYQYGENDFDVPLAVHLQCNHQMLCAGPQCKLVWVPAVLPGLEFKLFRVDRHEETIAKIIERSHWFWRHVVNGVRPADSTPTEDILKRRKRPIASIDLTDEDAKAWLDYYNSNEKLKGAQTDRDGYYAGVLARLGDAEVGRLPDGGLITFLSQNSPRRYDGDRLRILLEDAQRSVERFIDGLEFDLGQTLGRPAVDIAGIYDAVVSQSQHRVLRKKEFKRRK